jgi:ribosomal protein L11
MLHAKSGSTFSGTVKQILGTAHNMGKEDVAVLLIVKGLW